MKKLYKKAQEEMAGFAFIIIVVAVVLVVFLSIAFNSTDDEGPQSFEVESFLQASLAQTSDCHDGIKYLSVKQLIFDCSELKACEDGRISCTVLEDFLKEISDLAWKAGPDSKTSGYTLDILLNGEPMVPSITAGNSTKNYRGAGQSFSKNGNNYVIEFLAYG